MNNIETELIGGSIEYLRPKKSGLKRAIEDIIGITAIIIFVSALIWLASVSLH